MGLMRPKHGKSHMKSVKSTKRKRPIFKTIKTKKSSKESLAANKSLS